MSKVSRSTYQKLAEENKRLLKDIRILVEGDEDKWFDCYHRWTTKFYQEKQLNLSLKAAAKKYIKEHADELPEFLTKSIDEEEVR